MKLHLKKFSVSIDLDSESVVGIFIDGNAVYFIHSDSTITSFEHGEMTCYRFGVPINVSDDVTFLDYFNNFNAKDFFDGLSQKNEKKLVSKKFSKRSWCKKS